METDYGPTRAGDGMVLKTKAQIVGGEYDGRPFYINYNLENADPEAEEIGQRDFASLRRATGVLEPTETEQLHFKPFGVVIGIKARKGTGELENVIKGYLFDDEALLPVNDNRAAAGPAAATRAGAKAKPWSKKK